MEQVLLYTLIIAFLVAVLISPILIPLLRRLKFGQSIREEGPKSHYKKAGTPTMGGLIILIAALVAASMMTISLTDFSYEMILLIFVTLGFGMIGFLDDFIIIVLKRNLGLTSRQKMILQLVIAACFTYGLIVINHPTTVHIPGTSYTFDLGFLYFVLVMFMLVGTSNAVNLTDGLDGLLAGTAAIAFGAFAVLSWGLSHFQIALFSTALVGALLGFLVFNAHPAKVFMGDTGSLALGGALAGVAVLTELEILLVIIGGVFVIETLSVIIQVISFKTTGKRVFKMSPLHHHYELSGWSEWRVVVTFWTVGLLLGALGIYLEVWM